MKRILLFASIFFSTTCLFAQAGQWHTVYTYDNSEHNDFGAISPIDENLVYAIMDGGRFLKTTDGGTTWSENNIGVSEVFFDMAFLEINFGFAVGANGTIVKTTDGGQTWTSLVSGTTEDLFSVDMLSLNNIWVVGHHGTVLHSVNGGANWTLDNSLTTEKLNSVEFVVSEGYIAGNNGTLLYTVNNGVNWTSLSVPSTNDFSSLNFTHNYVRFLSGIVNEDYHEVFSYEYYESTDNVNWTNHSIGNGLPVSSLYFGDDHTGFYIECDVALCSCSYLNIHRTSDTGANWDMSYCAETQNSNYPFHGGYSDIDFVDDQVGFALVREYIFKTTNGGTDWTQGNCQFFDLEEFADSPLFSIYPNPSHEKIQIKSKTGFNSLSLEILNLNGRLVLSKKRIDQNPINISNLENGIYFVKIIRDGKTLGAEKLVKK